MPIYVIALRVYPYPHPDILQSVGYRVYSTPLIACPGGKLRGRRRNRIVTYERGQRVNLCDRLSLSPDLILKHVGVWGHSKVCRQANCSRSSKTPISLHSQPVSSLWGWDLDRPCLRWVGRYPHRLLAEPVENSLKDSSRLLDNRGGTEYHEYYDKPRPVFTLFSRLPPPPQKAACG